MVFFNSILKMLGKRINYDAVVNYAGNSFAKDAWKMIQESNPLVDHDKMKNNGFMSLLSTVKVAKSVKEASKSLGDMSWVDFDAKPEASTT